MRYILAMPQEQQKKRSCIPRQVDPDGAIEDRRIHVILKNKFKRSRQKFYCIWANANTPTVH